MILTVTVPSAEIYKAYDYGYGEVLHIEHVTLANGQEWLRYTVAFEDSYNARCQEGRFASGLYFGDLFDEVADR